MKFVYGSNASLKAINEVRKITAAYLRVHKQKEASTIQMISK